MLIAWATGDNGGERLGALGVVPIPDCSMTCDTYTEALVMIAVG